MSSFTFRKSVLFRFIALTVLTAFAGMLPVSPSMAQVAIIMPPPGQMIHITRHFEPPQMVGLKVNLKDPFSFDFIMDQGETSMPDDVRKKEFNKIIKYFLVSLTMPNSDMWVNLSPYESQRIIPPIFAQTEMGRDLLAQDYVLKQFTASLMYPEDGLGRKFWDKVYAQAQARFGTTDISVNTFNKVWIIADHADVYQKDDTAFLIDSHLKVMLEQDYMALEKHKEMFGAAKSVNTVESMDAKTKMASDLVRQIIIPAIEKEVNEGKSFAAVRQVYNAEIMATWFKKTLKESLLGQVFANKSRIAGQRVNDPQAMEKIYKQYLRAYKKGVFNYIREDATPEGQTIPRKYFSGGMKAMTSQAMKVFTPAMMRKMPAVARKILRWVTKKKLQSNKNEVLVVDVALKNSQTGTGFEETATEATQLTAAAEDNGASAAHLETTPEGDEAVAAPLPQAVKKVRFPRLRKMMAKLSDKTSDQAILRPIREAVRSIQDMPVEMKVNVRFKIVNSIRAAIGNLQSEVQQADKAIVKLKKRQAAKGSVSIDDELRSWQKWRNYLIREIIALRVVITACEEHMKAADTEAKAGKKAVSAAHHAVFVQIKEINNRIAHLEGQITDKLNELGQVFLDDVRLQRNYKSIDAEVTVADITQLHDFYEIKNTIEDVILALNGQINGLATQRKNLLQTKGTISSTAPSGSTETATASTSSATKFKTKILELTKMVSFSVAGVAGTAIGAGIANSINGQINDKRNKLDDLEGYRDSREWLGLKYPLKKLHALVSKTSSGRNIQAEKAVLESQIFELKHDRAVALGPEARRKEFIRIIKAELLDLYHHDLGEAKNLEVETAQSFFNAWARAPRDFNERKDLYRKLKKLFGIRVALEFNKIAIEAKTKPTEAEYTAKVAAFSKTVLVQFDGLIQKEKAEKEPRKKVLENFEYAKRFMEQWETGNPEFNDQPSLKVLLRVLRSLVESNNLHFSEEDFDNLYKRNVPFKARGSAAMSASLTKPKSHQHVAKAQKVGGINLSDENLTINIKVDGKGMPLPARFQDKAMLNLSGLTSIIRKISPLTPQNVPVLFELVK